MSPRIYWINANSISNETLGTMARPRGNDWLEDEIIWMKKQNINTIVSLLESHEVEELGLRKEKEFCERHGIHFINYPIEDRQIPESTNQFLKLVDLLVRQIKESQKVVIHCRMGIGRASILAAGILIRSGEKIQTIFETISKYRTLKVPDVESQAEWLKNTLSSPNKTNSENNILKFKK